MPIGFSRERVELEKLKNAVRWGILGAADIAVHKVIPAMADAEMCSVDAIASRSEERARQTAERFGIPRSYGSYQDLLEDSDIEAVYIPLPNHLHLEWTLAAAAAGKHILCEKPLAMSSADARTMIDACDAAGVKLMEAFMYRLHPMWVEVRRLVDDGAIGELAAIQSFFSYFNNDPADIRNIPEFGGGALYDIGCYPVNVARMLFDSEPTEVKSSIKRDPDFGTDIVTSAVLDFGGRHATFTCSTRMEDHQWVGIEGTEGRLVVEIPFNIPSDRSTRILHYAGGEPPAKPGLEIHEVPAANQYGIQADAFARAVRDDTPVPTPVEDAVGNLMVIEQIFADGAS
jgi:predicted dehydrogenase